LETPLFRVRNKKVTTYCYNEQEKNLAMEKISHHEITRFKGLGEISPGEFKQFIGGKMRLIQVVTQNIHKIDDTLQFFMGKNTPTRKNFIINNLIADIGV
jgi:DNA gyrase/topoisomerase IV subunit B